MTCSSVMSLAVAINSFAERQLRLRLNFQGLTSELYQSCNQFVRRKAIETAGTRGPCRERCRSVAINSFAERQLRPHKTPSTPTSLRRCCNQLVRRKANLHRSGWRLTIYRSPRPLRRGDETAYKRISADIRFFICQTFICDNMCVNTKESFNG